MSEIPTATPRRATIDVFNIVGGRCRTCHQHLQGARHRRLELRWWLLLEIPTAPTGGLQSTSSTLVVVTTGPAASTPGGPPSMSSTPVVAAAGNPNSTHRGPTVDVFNIDGGRCRTYRQHPQGAHHRHLQLRWWPLPEILTSTPRGPTIDVFNIGGGRCRTCRQHPQGVRHLRLQLRWWPLSEILTATPRGPPSTSSTSVVVAAGPAASTPRGPAIDVCLNLVPSARIILAAPTRGPPC
jgi:hypothetical protein